MIQSDFSDNLELLILGRFDQVHSINLHRLILLHCMLKSGGGSGEKG